MKFKNLKKRVVLLGNGDELFIIQKEDKTPIGLTINQIKKLKAEMPKEDYEEVFGGLKL